MAFGIMVANHAAIDHDEGYKSSCGRVGRDHHRAHLQLVVVLKVQVLIVVVSDWSEHRPHMRRKEDAVQKAMCR